MIRQKHDDPEFESVFPDEEAEYHYNEWCDWLEYKELYTDINSGKVDCNDLNDHQKELMNREWPQWLEEQQ